MKFFNLLSINFLTNSLVELAFISSFAIFCQVFLNVKLSNKKIIFTILLNYIIFSISNLFDSYSTVVFFSIISLIITFYIMLKIPKEIILYFTSIVSTIGLNVYIICSKIINSTEFNFQFHLLVCNLIILFISLLIELSIYLYIKHYEIDKLLEQSICKKSNFISIVSLITIILNNFILLTSFDFIISNNIHIFALNTYYYLSLNLIVHYCHSEYTHQRLNNLKLCNKTILSMYDDTRAFKHDFHNIMQAIGGYVTINDMEGLKEYYKNIHKDCKISNSYTKLNSRLVNNPAIYSILADKYAIANKNNIDINLDVMLDLNKLNINIYELSRILGILLDNAIEASKECKQKNINVTFKQDKNKQLLIIENTYSDKQISIDKIFEKSYTTKPHNTGLGLWEVRKILQKNSNLNLYTSKNNDYFSQQLEIYSA